jgi:rubrerythrin
MKEEKIPRIADYEKMCFLSDSTEKERMEILRDMAKNPQYICTACGRAASSKEAVCSPEDMGNGKLYDSHSEKVHLGDPGLPDYEKMCFLSDSTEKRRMEMLKSMANDPQYICSACGRVASRKEAICSPEKL